MLLGCTVVTQSQTTGKKNSRAEKEHTIDIIIYREGLLKTPHPKLSEHKHHDVVVYKGEVGAAYGIAFYLMEKDSLREGGWGVELDNREYDVVRYHWTNDTTVVLIFHNSATKKEKSFSISGNTKRSEMRALKTH
jgi:hypothetical protein